MRKVGAMAVVLAAILPALAAGAGEQAAAPSSHLGDRRVAISLTFSGQRVFLYGQPPHGTDTMLAVMLGPQTGTVELVRRERVLGLWPGVERYAVTGAPGLYLVNVHCPACNRSGDCGHSPDLEAWNRILESEGRAVGIEDLRSRTVLEGDTGVPDGREARRVVQGFWDLHRERGLFGVNRNSIRMNDQGLFYHTFELPAEAPEGRYRIRTYFSRNGNVIGVADNELLVRKSGLVARLSRLSERREVSYASLTVIIPILAGILASIVFHRGQKH
jgi:hypothetical protein